MFRRETLAVLSGRFQPRTMCVSVLQNRHITCTLSPFRRTGSAAPQHQHGLDSEPERRERITLRGDHLPSRTL